MALLSKQKYDSNLGSKLNNALKKAKPIGQS